MKILEMHNDGNPARVEINGVVFVRESPQARPDDYEGPDIGMHDTEIDDRDDEDQA